MAARGPAHVIRILGLGGVHAGAVAVTVVVHGRFGVVAHAEGVARLAAVDAEVGISAREVDG